MLYINLFLSLLKCGLIAFGGGASMVPLIEDETVRVLGIMTVDEFANAYAIGNSLPGPITTKLAALIGYKVGGYLGSVLAITAILLPSSVLMLTLYSLYKNHSDNAKVRGMVTCIKPIILVMIIRLFLSTGQNLFANSTDNTLLLILLTLLALIGILLLKLPPTLFIFIACLAGVCFYQ